MSTPIAWPESERLPRTPDASIPMYAVTWDTTPRRRITRRSGNRWASKAKAEEVFAAKAEDGRNPHACVEYFAGFIDLRAGR